MKRIVSIILCFTGALVPLVHADPADYDLTFGNGGTTSPLVNGLAPTFEDVAIDSKGRIVIVGTATNTNGDRDISVIRLNPDGSMDGSFGTTGKVLIDFSSPGSGTLQDEGKAVAIDVNDNIYIVGHSGSGDTDMTIMRLNGDGPNPGGFDTTFLGTGFGGIVATSDVTDGSLSDVAESILIQPDGKILVGGSTEKPSSLPPAGQILNFTRILPNGTFDPAFNSGATLYVNQGGTVTTQSLTAMALDAAGNILFSHNTVDDGNIECGVGRLTPGGALDATFGSGIGTTGFGDPLDDEITGINTTITGLAVTADGKAVVCGSRQVGADVKIYIARYSSDGTTHDFVTETDFGSDLEAAENVAIDQAGRIVVVGTSSGGPGLAVIRYTANGNLDPAFNAPFGGFTDNVTGSADELARGIAIQQDGRIVTAGQTSAPSLFVNRIIGTPVAFQPDNIIGPARNRGKGNNIYNGNGSGQRVNLTSLKVKKVSGFLRIQNDGTAIDTFALRGTGNNALFKVKYFNPGGPVRNITASTISGAQRFPNVSPSQSVLIQCRVTPSKTNLRIPGSPSARRAKRAYRFTTGSTSDTSLRDVAILGVQTK